MSGEKELYSIVLTPEDVKKAAEHVDIVADSSTREVARGIVGTGNAVLDKYMRKYEGVGVRDVLNSGSVYVKNNLGNGILGTYQPGAGITSLLRKYVVNPMHGLVVYTHEGTHRLMDKVFNYGRAVRKYAEKYWEKDPILALGFVDSANELQEGLTEVVRLRAVGQSGVVSAYQRGGLVGAAEYALNKVGGKIKNVVGRLDEAVGHFEDALYNPRLQLAQVYSTN